MRKPLSIALATVAILLTVTALGQAEGMANRRMADDGRHDAGHQHDGRGYDDGRHDRDDHRRPFFRGPFVYWNPYPVYAAPINGYWYYCPSAEAYYPYVTNCLDAWVPVPAQ